MGPWLYRFISAISFKWNLISSINKKYIFVKKEINLKDVILLGIEDYQKIKNTRITGAIIVIQELLNTRFPINFLSNVTKKN